MLPGRSIYLLNFVVSNTRWNANLRNAYLFVDNRRDVMKPKCSKLTLMNFIPTSKGHRVAKARVD